MVISHWQVVFLDLFSVINFVLHIFMSHKNFYPNSCLKYLLTVVLKMLSSCSQMGGPCQSQFWPLQSEETFKKAVQKWSSFSVYVAITDTKAKFQYKSPKH